MTGTQITDNKKLIGRSRKAHIARKLSMPWENPEKLDEIDWNNYDNKDRSYNVYNKTGGKRVVLYEANKHVARKELAKNRYTGRYKDEVKKGKWV